jgi:MSHA biogenesis protein MshJ
MKRYWERGLAWIDGLKFRERVLLFGAIVAVLAVMTDFLFVSSVTEQQKKLTSQIDSQSADSEARRDRMQTAQMRRERDRITTLEADVAKLQAEADAVDRDISALSSPTGDAAGMSAVLARVLKRNDRVKLVRVVSAGAEAVTPAPPLPGGLAALATAPIPGTSALPAVTAPAANAVPATLQRNALDITLSGSYLDLMDYVATLEKTMPSLRWGALKFSTSTAPSQLTVRIMLISAGP